MAGGEDEAQEIVADVVVDCCVEIRHGLFLSLKLATEFLVLALEPRVSAEVIDGTMLGSGHKPGAWIVWDARLRPLLESSDESILCEILGSTDVAHDPARDRQRASATRFSRLRRWRDVYRWPSRYRSHHL